MQTPEFASTLFRPWRVLATGFAFAALGLGGFVLALTWFPVLRATSADAGIACRRTQLAIRAAFRIYLGMLRGLGLIRLRVDGAGMLAACQGRLVVANHPTLLDVVLVAALLPNAQCVVKHQLWASRLLGPVVRAAGYIRNDLAAEELLAACRAALAAGNNLIIFPEGTRSVPGQAMRMQRGFANVALLAPADLLVLRITCQPLTLVKHVPWWRVPPRRANFRVGVASALPIAPYLADGPRAIAARRLTRDVQSLLEPNANDES